MTDVTGDILFDFYDLDADKVADAHMYTSGSRATAEEITVIRMKDAKDVGLAEAAMKQRVEDQKRSYQDYIPEELPKLEGAVVLTHGSYALLAVADDPSKVEETFKAQF